jgi:DNA-directed RNA polymerase subunit F
MKNFILIFLLISSTAFASKRLTKKVDYKTYFGECPSNVAGKLTLELVKTFEETKSLKSVKELIVKNKLSDKYFLSEYKIYYDPIKDRIKFNYNCPAPVMKVQIYKDNGDEFYTAILADNGKLLDPTYEVLLRSEKILKNKLPHLAIPLKALDSKLHEDITRLVSDMNNAFRKKISEVIINENNELTIILSVHNRPSSAFLGKDYWSDKIKKLVKIIGFMKKKKRIPTVINLTNTKKVVVKF